MPELPEVEQVRRGLAAYLMGHQVRAVEVLRRDFVQPPRANLQVLVGQRFTETLRHGKKLFLRLEDGHTLLLHLGMTGRVDAIAPDPAAPLPPRALHTHVAIGLDTGVEIRLRDPRRFGGLWYYRRFEDAWRREVQGRLGPDALLLTAENLAHWRHTRGRLKARLLSQKDVAGLGNIYVDEALWQTRLHPEQRVSRLRAPQVAELVAAIREILGRSIQAGGTTFRDYRNVAGQRGDFVRQLQAYGRGGQPCGRCGQPLRLEAVAGRTTVFCPLCQRRR